MGERSEVVCWSILGIDARAGSLWGSTVEMTVVMVGGNGGSMVVVMATMVVDGNDGNNSNDSETTHQIRSLSS